MSRVRTPRLCLTLVEGALRIEGPPDRLCALAGWLPADARREPTRSRPGQGALIQVRPPLAARSRPTPPAGPPTLRLAGAGAWPLPRCRWLLRGPSGAVGRLDLEVGRACLRAPDGAPELAGMAGIAAALLLGRRGRALVHAGAVVAPGGDAWLLPGDGGAGKTTTTETLARGGWAWLADDRVVLAEENGAVVVEGWPRGYRFDARAATGSGIPAARRRAVLAGLLLPRVRRERPTALRPAGAGEALAALVRQSPWLLADPVAAPALLAVLRAAAALPAFHLSLGTDTLGRSEALTRLLAPLMP